MLTHDALDVTSLSAAIAVIGCQCDVGIKPEFGAPVLSVDVHMSRLTTIIRVKVEALRFIHIGQSQRDRPDHATLVAELEKLRLPPQA